MAIRRNRRVLGDEVKWEIYWRSLQGRLRISEIITRTLRRLNHLPGPKMSIEFIYDAIRLVEAHPPDFSVVLSVMEHEHDKFYEYDSGWWALTYLHTYSAAEWEDWLAAGIA